MERSPDHDISAQTEGLWNTAQAAGAALILGIALGGLKISELLSHNTGKEEAPHKQSEPLRSARPLDSALVVGDPVRDARQQ